MKLFHLIILLLFLSVTTKAQITISPDESVRKFHPNFLGLNGRSTEGPSWTDTGFISLIEQMNPGVVRYPAGTQANYWDWRYGTFIEGCGKSSPYDFSIENFVNGLPSQSRIIYVVNMARPTPVTGVALDASETELRSLTTLNLKISDMLEALAEFERLGKIPMAVELGNEFYFNNEHAAIYAANPELYIEHSKIICNAIKSEYPGIKILLITTKGGTTGRDYWNNSVINALLADNHFSNQIYALVQHHYINDKFGSTTIIHNNESAELAIAEGFQYTREHLADYNLTPDPFKLWLTEYGIVKENAENTWASGLRATAMSLGWLELGEKIEQLVFHHITEDPGVLNKAEMKLGSVGLNIELFNEAVKGKTKVQKLNFSGNYYISSTEVETLHGFKFISDSTESVFILNIGEEEHANLNINNLFNYTGIPQIKQYWSNNPSIVPTYEGVNVLKNEYNYAGAFSIPPFSVTHIKAEYKGVYSAVKNERVKKNVVYPTIYNEEFTVRINELHARAYLSIYDLNGREVYACIVKAGISKHSPDLHNGIYILRLSTKNETINRTIIKAE